MFSDSRSPARPGARAARLSTLLAALCLAACASQPDSPAPTRAVGLANPATLACLSAGGSAFNTRAADGAERGLCRFPSGQVCDQWAFFRGECRPDPVDRRPGS